MTIGASVTEVVLFVASIPAEFVFSSCIGRSEVILLLKVLAGPLGVRVNLVILIVELLAAWLEFLEDCVLWLLVVLAVAGLRSTMIGSWSSSGLLVVGDVLTKAIAFATTVIVVASLSL